MHLNSLTFCVVEATNDGRELPKYVMDLSILTDTNKQNITDLFHLPTLMHSSFIH